MNPILHRGGVCCNCDRTVLSDSYTREAAEIGRVRRSAKINSREKSSQPDTAYVHGIGPASAIQIQVRRARKCCNLRANQVVTRHTSVSYDGQLKVRRRNPGRKINVKVFFERHCRDIVHDKLIALGLTVVMKNREAIAAANNLSSALDGENSWAG